MSATKHAEFRHSKIQRQSHVWHDTWPRYTSIYTSFDFAIHLLSAQIESCNKRTTPNTTISRWFKTAAFLHMNFHFLPKLPLMRARTTLYFRTLKITRKNALIQPAMFVFCTFFVNNFSSATFLYHISMTEKIHSGKKFKSSLKVAN